MGAIILPAFLTEEQTARALVATAQNAHQYICSIIRSTSLAPAIQGVDVSNSLSLREYHVTHPAIYIPLVDGWTYEESGNRLHCEGGTVRALCCTSAGGKFSLKRKSWMLIYAFRGPTSLFFTASPTPKIAEQLTVSIFTDLVSKEDQLKYVDLETIETDGSRIRMLLKEVVPRWEDHTWSCLHVYKIEKAETLRLPGCATHLVLMYLQENAMNSSRCTIRIDLCDVYTIGSGSAIHLTRTPREIKTSATEVGPYYVAYVFAWREEEDDDETTIHGSSPKLGSPKTCSSRATSV